MIYRDIFMVSFGISLFLLLYLHRLRRSKLGIHLIVLTILTSFWLLCEGGSYYLVSEEAQIFLQRAKYISIIFIPPILFLTAFVFSNGLRKERANNFGLVFVVPLISTFSLATNIFPYAFIENCKSFYDGDILLFLHDKRIGFWVHTYYSYLVIIATLLMLLYRAIKAPKIYKAQSFFVFFGATVSIFTNFIFLIKITENNFFDTTPLFILVTLIIFYWGIYYVPRNELIPQARNLVIENMNDLLILVDNKKNIIDINPAVKSFF